MAAVEDRKCFLMVLFLFAQSVSAQIPTARAKFLNESAGQMVALKVSRDDVRMTCTLLHLPQTDAVVAVHWQRIAEDGSSGLSSGVSFTGSLKQTLLLDNFSPLNDTGNYSCIIETRSGRSYTSNDLELRSKSLKIYAQTNPVEVLRHSTAKLNCIIRSPPGVSYRTEWYKGNTKIKDVPGYEPLVIDNVTTSKEGQYDCIVKNTANDDDASLDLVIVDIPVFMSSPTNGLPREKGVEIGLYCASMTAGTISFTWDFNGKAVNLSYVSNTSQSSSLTIASASFDDQGNYTCTASNLAGNSTQIYSIEVVGSPEIRSRGSELEEVVHSTVVLDCQSVANPPVEATQWVKVGEPSIPGQYQMLNNDSLVLYNVTEATSGNYSCTVKNSRGEASIMYELTVLGLPSAPTSFVHTILSQDNQSVLLTWNIPQVLPRQRLDGFQLELWTTENPQHQQMFYIAPNVSRRVFNNLFPGERYHARLRSYNRAGNSSPQTTSFLLPITAPKLDLLVTPLPGGRSLSVEWTLVYDGGPDVVKFVFEVYVAEGAKVMVYTVSPRLDAGEHLITGLQPTTKYMVCVTIGNNVMATTLNQVINTTAAPPSRPSSLDISAVTTRHVQLSFTVLEGSEPISHFLINITTNGDAEPSQKIISRDDQDQVESLGLEDGHLHVELVVLNLHPFTTYSFQVAAVSDVGTGEYSSATKPVQLEDARIVYFMVGGVVGGVFLVVGVVMTTLLIMVWRSKASQRRKRTFSVNASGQNKPENSFASQSPPSCKKDRGSTPSSRGLSSPTCSTAHDVPSLLVMDIAQHSGRQQHGRTPSCEKLSSCRTRPDSLASDSYFPGSVGVFEKRPSISHSESGVSRFIKPSPTSSLPQSQLHGSMGKMPVSILNPLYPRHQILTDHTSSSGQNIYVEVSPQGQEMKSLGMSQNAHTPPVARTGHSPLPSHHAGYISRQTSLQSHGSHAPLHTHGSHTPFMHQTSVQHHSAQLLSLPPNGILSSSAPMINMRISRESILETANPNCMTDV